MRTLPILSAIALSTSLASAQCAFSSVSVSSYGQGCSAVFANNPVTVGASLDASNCVLGLDVDAFPGCCNTYLVAQVLVLGLQPAAVPVPDFGPNCTLLAAPDVILFEVTPGGTGPFQLPLPQAPFPATTLFGQPAALYFTTIGLSIDWSLGAGAQIDLQ